jgi:hypothetical protein
MVLARLTDFQERNLSPELGWCQSAGKSRSSVSIWPKGAECTEPNKGNRVRDLREAQPGGDPCVVLTTPILRAPSAYPRRFFLFLSRRYQLYC